jgi:hypothetical protein
MERRAIHIMLVANMAVCVALLCLLTLQTFGWVRLFEEAEAPHLKTLMAGLTLAFVVANGVYLYEMFVAQRSSHFASRSGEAEYLISIGALEESLGRVARKNPEVYEARVTVRKERAAGSPVVVEVRFTAYEDMAVPQLTERLREVLRRRFEEVAGAAVKPQFHLILSRIVEKEDRGKQVRPGGEKGGQVIDLSKGPIYPVADDIPS